MSDQPLGRDRLGRLMYPGDYVWPHKPDDPYWIPVWREEDGRVAFDEGFGLAEHITLPEFVTIDLTASPKMTNYQRYFADLGTLDEIQQVVSLDVCGTGEVIGGQCRCEVGDLALGNSHGCVDAFFDWLQQEATV